DGEHRSCPGRWRGSVSLGFGSNRRRVRRVVNGRAKTEVKNKLQDLHDELHDGIRSSPTYTVQNAVDDWLAHGLDGRSAKTISTNREVLAPLTALIGAAKLRDPKRPTSGRRWRVRYYPVHQDCPDRPQRPCPCDPLRRGERSRGQERGRARD